MKPPAPDLADRPADVEVSPGDVLATSFRDLVSFEVTLRPGDGAKTIVRRELLRTGRVVAVLAVDAGRREVVLIRQFRLSAHLTMGLGDMVEVVAGYVEPGDLPIAAAERECVEEIGVRPDALIELMTFLPAPGLSEELATLFLASVDASRVPERAGSPDEQEDTRPMRIAIDAAIAAHAQGTIHNGYLVIALQWLALNHRRLDEFLRTGVAAAR